MGLHHLYDLNDSVISSLALTLSDDHRTVNYILDDAMSFPTVDPTESPTSEPSVNPTKNPTSLVSKSTSASATSFGLPNNGNGAIASAPNPPTTSPVSRNQADEKLKMYTSEATKSSIAIGIGFFAISLLLAQLFCFTE